MPKQERTPSIPTIVENDVVVGTTFKPKGRLSFCLFTAKFFAQFGVIIFVHQILFLFNEFHCVYINQFFDQCYIKDRKVRLLTHD